MRVFAVTPGMGIITCISRHASPHSPCYLVVVLYTRNRHGAIAFAVRVLEVWIFRMKDSNNETP